MPQLGNSRRQYPSHFSSLSTVVGLHWSNFFVSFQELAIIQLIVVGLILTLTRYGPVSLYFGLAIFWFQGYHNRNIYRNLLYSNIFLWHATMLCCCCWSIFVLSFRWFVLRFPFSGEHLPASVPNEITADGEKKTLLRTCTDQISSFPSISEAASMK